MIEQNFRKILARGIDGEEHYLEVTKLSSGLITIRDGEMTRLIMARSAALELCLRLVTAIGDEPSVMENIIRPRFPRSSAGRD